MSLKRTIAFNSLVQLASKVATVIFGTLTIAIMARYLGQEGFGQYSTVIAYLAFFGILVDFGLQISMVNLMSKHPDDEDAVFRNTLSLRSLSALVLFVLAPLIMLLFPFDEVIKTGTFILTLNYALLAIHQLLIGFFQKKLKMDKIAIAEITGKILLLGGIWAAAALDWGLYGMLWVIVASTGAQVIMGLWYAHGFTSLRWEFDFSWWKRILSNSWPIAIATMFNLVYFKADTLVLSLTRSQAEVGIYSAPYRVLEILTGYPYLFVGLIFPLIAAAWAQVNKDRFEHFFQTSFNLLVMAAVPMIAGTLPLAERLMVLLAGEEFAASGIVLQYLIVATGIIFVNVIFAYVVVIIDKQRQMIAGYAVTAVVALTSYLIFIPIYSYIAAAIITIIAECMIFGLNMFMVTKNTQFFPKLAIFWKSLLASLIMVGSILIAWNLPLLLIVALAMLVYGIMLYLLGAISKQTLIEIFKPR